MCERHNQFLTNMLHKIHDDVNCDYNVALAWPASEKNVLINHYGFSQAQLVLGRASNLPGTINKYLPALPDFIS